MAGKCDKPEEIVSKLRRMEVLHDQGMPVVQAVRQIGVTELPNNAGWHVNHKRVVRIWRREGLKVLRKRQIWDVGE